MENSQEQFEIDDDRRYDSERAQKVRKEALLSWMEMCSLGSAEISSLAAIMTSVPKWMQVSRSKP